jgi:tRNA G18 (ribose-2'-O)-methylase SpoU
VVRRLLETQRFGVRSLLVSEAAFRSVADALEPPRGRADVPVFVCPLPMLAAIAGFNFHRGCLAIGERPPPARADDLLRQHDLVVILERVLNADNVGGVFRNAAAFDAGAVLLSPGCCDPLYRKAIRTSAGAALSVPFAPLEPWPEGLERVRGAGFTLAALTPRNEAVAIGDFVRSANAGGRLALMLGTEGGGLTPEAERLADVRVRIPISAAMDSLNVATAAAIALHRISEATSG